MNFYVKPNFVRGLKASTETSPGTVTPCRPGTPRQSAPPSWWWDQGQVEQMIRFEELKIKNVLRVVPSWARRCPPLWAPRDGLPSHTATQVFNRANSKDYR